MRPFCDLQGQEAGLGRCIGSGGEGAVYSLPMRPRFVAKIYARTPDDQTTRKLGAMVQLGTEALASFAAWPQNLLLDPQTGATVGGAFGGDNFSAAYHTRRGMEKWLFWATIITATLFAVVAIAILLV